MIPCVACSTFVDSVAFMPSRKSKGKHGKRKPRAGTHKARRALPLVNEGRHLIFRFPWFTEMDRMRDLQPYLTDFLKAFGYTRNGGKIKKNHRRQ